MTEQHNPTPAAPITTPQEPIELAERKATEAGLEIKYTERHGRTLVITYPPRDDKQNPREIPVGSDEIANALLETNFERLIPITGYEAFLDPSTDSVEARVRSPSIFGPRESGFPGLPLGLTLTHPDSSDDRKLSICRSSLPLELTCRPGALPPIKDLDRLDRLSGISIVAQGFGIADTVAADRLIRTTLEGFLFEVDITQGTHLTLARTDRPRHRRLRREAPDSPPEFPKNTYDTEALQLYKYARSARGMPLLEFLAFYQAVEFYFPRYTDAALRLKIRNLLKDPRFNAHKEREISRMIGLLRGKGSSWSKESSQLRETINSCLDPSEISEFIQENEKHFRDKKTPLNVSPVVLADKKTNVVDAASTRLYQIRCKIVHTKENEGGHTDEVDLLLPDSAEAALLGTDIELMRLIAGRVITASSSALED